MRILKNNRRHPKISFILLDWSVRESFHVLWYLERQTAHREDFEVIVIEFYERIAEPIRRFEPMVDQWILLEMPAEAYYHKHLMYNVGIVLARGEIVTICDSDAMVRETFVASILRAFESGPPIVLHVDQFRNQRRDLYPFAYPSFETVIGDGCINRSGDRTIGVADRLDPLHSRNYGACMCARRDDLIMIGGADEHADFIGHICGPYDLTFRLANAGVREIWLEREFTYHTWHPGQAGTHDYFGPHDGRHMSLTSLQALVSGRILPLKENPAIAAMRKGESTRESELIGKAVDYEKAQAWRLESLQRRSVGTFTSERDYLVKTWGGARIIERQNRYFVEPIGQRSNERHRAIPDGESYNSVAEAQRAIWMSLESGVKARILGWRVFSRVWCGLKMLVRMQRLMRIVREQLTRQGRGRASGKLCPSAGFPDDGMNMIVYLLSSRKPYGHDSNLVLALSGIGNTVPIQFLIFLRLLPCGTVVNVRKLDIAELLVQRFERGGIGTLLISSGTYANYYTAWSRLPRDKTIVV